MINLLSSCKFEYYKNSFFGKFIDNIHYEVFDGMFEGLAERGYTKTQYQIVFDSGLVEYHREMRDHNFPENLRIGVNLDGSN